MNQVKYLVLGCAFAEAGLEGFLIYTPIEEFEHTFKTSGFVLPD